MEWIVESIMDCLKMLPFLFAAFACMEAVEHYSGNKMNQMLEKAGHEMCIRDSRMAKL